MFGTWPRSDAVTRAEQDLAEASRNAPLDRVYAFVNRRDFPVEPTAEQDAALISANAALERARELEQQIDDELQRSTAAATGPRDGSDSGDRTNSRPVAAVSGFIRPTHRCVDPAAHALRIIQ